MKRMVRHREVTTVWVGPDGVERSVTYTQALRAEDRAEAARRNKARRDEAVAEAKGLAPGTPDGDVDPLVLYQEACEQGVAKVIRRSEELVE